MGYGREIYSAVGRTLEERRKRAEREAEKRRAVFFQRFPRAEELESLLASTSIAAARAVLKSGHAREQLTRLKERNLALQREFRELLRADGRPEDDLEPHYTCANCRDTGYVDGKMCACMKGLLRAEAYRRLNAQTPLSLSTFESFSLGYYPESADGGQRSPRGAMQAVLATCRRYAAEFSPSSPSLLLQGGTGLGKTHLSLAIANEVLKKGFGVIYCSVSNIVDTLEREHFGRSGGDTGPLLLECDLLILDDLGTEFKSAFSSAEIYNIVNTRLMARKPTVISTNLFMQELQDRYTERFASRIMGNYARLVFFGKDNRLQKLLQRS